MIPRSQAMHRPDRRSMVATELHAGQQAGAALASSTPRPEQTIWFRPAAPEIAIEWLLRLIPEAEAKLYGVLTELIPAPSMVKPNLACRQIKMAKLAKLAGLSRRWVIMLLPRLEKRDLIRTQGGRGAAKWIWLLSLGVPRLGKPSSTELTQKEKTRPEPIPGKAKAQRAAAAQPKRRRQETEQSVKVAPPVERSVEIPKRRQKAPLPSTPPTDRSPKGPVLVTRVTPAPPTASGSPAVPAAAVKPPPPTAPGNLTVPADGLTPPPATAPARAVLAPKVIPPPAPSNPVVPAAAPRRAAPAKAMQATVVTPPAPAAPVMQTAVVPPTVPGNPVVPAIVATPPSATAPASRAAQAAMVTPPPPAATVMPPPPTPAAQAVQAPPPAAPAAPAKPASRRSIKKIPAVRRPKKKAATIEELVAYIYPQPWPPNLIRDLKPPVMTAEELPFALHLLCRQPRRFNNRADFVSALRSALHDYQAQTSWYL